MIGRIVNQYRIVERLGGGGMGVVYKAEDLTLGRTVALKFLPPELLRDEEARRRLLHEARAAARLDHPNICTLHETGETPEGELYLVMACYAGETLRERIARGPLEIADAVELAAQAAEGLAHAHREGVVHRDVKPANLLVTPDRTLKILDFGLAKRAGQSVLTQTGTTLGTVAYMSPEQARGEPLDARTDLWALGVVLYEMVTGRPPFPGEYPQAVIYAILSEDPLPPGRLRPGLPAELGRTLARALDKDPARRYGSADEMAADLRMLMVRMAGEPHEDAGTGTSSSGEIPEVDRTALMPEPARNRPPWWVYLAMAASLGFLLVHLYMTFFGLQLSGIQPLGGNLVSDGKGYRVTGVPPDSAVAKAGLRPGDRLLAVDGRPADFTVLSSLHQYAESGRAYELSVEREGKPLALRMKYLPMTLRYWGRQANLVQLVMILESVFFVIMAGLIVFHRAGDSVALLGAAWLAALGIGMFFFMVGRPPGYFGFLRELPWPVAAFLVLAPVVAGSVSAELNCVFLASFPKNLFRSRWIYLLLWAPVLIRFPVISLWIGENVFGSEPQPISETMYPVIAFLRMAYWLLAIVIVVCNYRTLTDINQRRRLRLLLIGLLLILLAGIPSLIQLWEWGRVLARQSQAIYLPVIIASISILGVLALTVAILKQRLFGLRLMIRQGLQYAAARGLLLGLAPLCAGILALDLFLHADQPLQVILAARGWFYTVLGAAGVAAHLNRRKWLAALDRRFFRERYDAQRILAGVVQEIRRAGSLAEVAPRVTAQVAAALHPEFAALLVREPGASEYGVLAAAGGAPPPPLPADGKLAAVVRLLEKPVEVTASSSDWLSRQLPAAEVDFLRRARVEWLFPVSMSAGGPEVLLVIGPKRSEEPYGREDQDLLAAVTAALALRAETAS